MYYQAKGREPDGIPFASLLSTTQPNFKPKFPPSLQPSDICSVFPDTISISRIFSDSMEMSTRYVTEGVLYFGYEFLCPPKVNVLGTGSSKSSVNG